jgi:hypothetical protein
MQHQCSAACRFSFVGSRSVCSHSGNEHACSLTTCLTTDARGGDVICTWTGVVSAVVSARVDNTLDGNISRDSSTNDGCSSYNRKAIGYGITAKRKSLRYGSTTRNSTIAFNDGRFSYMDPAIVRVSEPRGAGAAATAGAAAAAPVAAAPAAAGASAARPAHGRAGAEAAARPSVFAPQRIRPVISRGVPNTQSSRVQAIAQEMVWCLFMNKSVRDALARRSHGKRTKLWRSAMRKRVVGNRPYASCVEIYAEWARAYGAVPSASDIEAPARAAPAAAAAPAPAARGQATMARVEPRGSLHDKLAKCLASFLLVGWQRLCKTTLFRQEPPDFTSFVMGVIYTARDGGITINGCAIIQELEFMKCHAPDVSQLSAVCGHLSLKDCRTSAYGRARIMEGMNAIRATLLYEEKHGCVPITELAFGAPPELLRTYCASATSPWQRFEGAGA